MKTFSPIWFWGFLALLWTLTSLFIYTRTSPKKLIRLTNNEIISKRMYIFECVGI